MQKLLTIVVPVYKVEKYISKCLDSLIVSKEQMQQLEVIVVNDGTPDNSAIMAKEYEKRYPDVFKIIDKENGGHGSAWNKGVELATGKYLRFLDSDDWLTNLSTFIDNLEKYDVDIVFTDLRVVIENQEKRNRIYEAVIAMSPNSIYEVNSFDWEKTDLMFGGYNVTNFHMCTYKTELLKKYHPIFLEKMFYDDEILFILPLCISQTFVYIKTTLYNYLLGREGQSMTPNIMIRNIDFKIKVRKYEVEFYNQHKPYAKSVDLKLQKNLNSRHMDTFRLMARLPRKESLMRMRQMSEWLHNNYKEFNGGRVYSIYKFSPKLFYRLYNTFQPIWSFIKMRIIN